MYEVGWFEWDVGIDSIVGTSPLKGKTVTDT